MLVLQMVILGSLALVMAALETVAALHGNDRVDDHAPDRAVVRTLTYAVHVFNRERIMLLGRDQLPTDQDSAHSAIMSASRAHTAHDGPSGLVDNAGDGPLRRVSYVVFVHDDSQLDKSALEDALRDDDSVNMVTLPSSSSDIDCDVSDVYAALGMVTALHILRCESPCPSTSQLTPRSDICEQSDRSESPPVRPALIVSQS